MLSLTVSRNSLVHQLDVNNTFLNGVLTEIVYCAQPTGFEDSTHMVWILCANSTSKQHMLQSVRILLAESWICGSQDYTLLFIYPNEAKMAYLLLYVHDIVLTDSSVDLLCCIISVLHQEFAMKDLGLHHFLGVHVQRCDSCLFL
jgi:histone deacetylase 1/2